MSWLEAETVLRLAGYALPTPPEGVELEDYLPSTKEGQALSFAEGLITSHTGLVFGEVVAFELRTRLEAASYYLFLPRDVQTVESVSPMPSAGHTFIMTGYALELFYDTGLQDRWRPGSYLITGTRGIEVIPEDINKAASLLAAYYLGLSDPERSRYAHMTLGDFSGTMRLMALPVPEAQALLNRYVSDVKVG